MKQDISYSHAINILKNNPYVQEVVLYGSYARSDVRPNSDVDLAVILTEDAPKQTLRDLRLECTPKDDSLPEVDIHSISKEWYLKEGTYYNEIRKDGIVVYEKQ